jgi:hypothetical protein
MRRPPTVAESADRLAAATRGNDRSTRDAAGDGCDQALHVALGDAAQGDA